MSFENLDRTIQYIQIHFFSSSPCTCSFDLRLSDKASIFFDTDQGYLLLEAFLRSPININSYGDLKDKIGSISIDSRKDGGKIMKVRYT